MSKTKIEWCDATWNPWVGCEKISAGCKFCYAEKMARRLKSIGVPQYQTVVDAGGWTGRIARAENIKIPGGKDKKIFVGSMTDFFMAPTGYYDEVFAEIYRNPQHTYMFLTKRPEAMREVIVDCNAVDSSMKNIWLGVTAENQECFCDRAKELITIEAPVRFVSCEPLLEPIYFGKNLLRKIGWVIVGCESGPNRRECKIEWIQDVVEQCHAADVPVFVKQVSIDGKVSKDMNEWPECLRIRQWPEF